MNDCQQLRKVSEFCQHLGYPLTARQQELRRAALTEQAALESEVEGRINALARILYDAFKRSGSMTAIVGNHRMTVTGADIGWSHGYKNSGAANSDLVYSRARHLAMLSIEAHH